MLEPSLANPRTPLHDGVEVGDALVDDEVDVCSEDVDSVLVPLLLLLVASSEEDDPMVLLILVVSALENVDSEVVRVGSEVDNDSEVDDDPEVADDLELVLVDSSEELDPKFVLVDSSEDVEPELALVEPSELVLVNP